MKKIFCFLLFTLPLSVMLMAQEVTSPTPSTISLSAATVADSMIIAAKHYLGTRYASGGTGPSSFDCSGFVGYIYRLFGYSLPRSSREQATAGREVSGDLSNLQKGDVLIFGGRSNSRVGHVGLFIERTGEKSFKFIHAARTGVIISEYSEDYYTRRFMGARRFLPDFYSDMPMDKELENLTGHSTSIRDTLTLKGDEQRIILLSDSTWILVAEDGSVTRPAAENKIILHGNGAWETVSPTNIQIPAHGRPQPKNTTTTASETTGESATNANEQAAAANPTEQTEKVYHTIRQGDTLYGLARKYHTSVKAICQLNGIKESTILQLGRKLRIK